MSKHFYWKQSNYKKKMNYLLFNIINLRFFPPQDPMTEIFIFKLINVFKSDQGLSTI